MCLCKRFSHTIIKRDVEASQRRAGVSSAETGTVSSTSSLSPSIDSMTAALGITSSTERNPVGNNVMEETWTSRRRQIRNSAIVSGNTSYILTGLTHFREYLIEVSILTSCKLMFTSSNLMISCATI